MATPGYEQRDRHERTEWQHARHEKQGSEVQPGRNDAPDIVPLDRDGRDGEHRRAGNRAKQAPREGEGKASPVPRGRPRLPGTWNPGCWRRHAVNLRVSATAGSTRQGPPAPPEIDEAVGGWKWEHALVFSYRLRPATAEDVVEKDNPDARRLYDRLGFVQVGETDREFKLRWNPATPTCVTSLWEAGG
jgi:hypothetical protein